MRVVNRKGIVTSVNQVKEMIIGAAGLDGGNSETKVQVLHGASELIGVKVPTIGLRRYKHQERTEHTKRTLEQTYVVTFDSPAVDKDITWLIGEGVSLERVSTLPTKPEPGSNKADVEVIMATALVSLARAAMDFRGVDKLPMARRELPVRYRFLGTNLPYQQYNKANKLTMKQKLVGTHKVCFADLAGVGAFTVIITVETLLQYPEGMPAVIAAAHDIKRGRVVAIRPELLEDTVAVLDLGGGTSDLCIFDEGLNLNGSQSDTLEWGVNNVLDEALKQLKGWVDTRAELASRLRSQDWIVKGKTDLDLRDVPDLMDGLKGLAEQVSTIVEKQWKNRIRHFFLVGGGALALKPFLTLPPEYPIETFDDSEWLNCRGNLYAALMALEEAEKQG